MTIQEAIVQVASNYIGIKEISGNKGWKNQPEFTRKMKVMGWTSGQSWCMYFVKLVLHEAYLLIEEPAKADWIKSNLTGSVLRSLKKLKSKPEIAIPTLTAEAGCVGFMRKGTSELGHSFIVTNIKHEKIKSVVTIEGNTSAATGSREGDGVYKRERSESFMLKSELRLETYVIFK